MRINNLSLCLLGALQCTWSLSAQAQQTTPATPAAAPVAAPAVAAPYELKSTSISGRASNRETILTSPVDADAAAYKLENGIYLYPTVLTSYGYDDNLLLRSNNVVGSGVVTLAPQVVAELVNRGDRYTAKAAVNHSNYTDSSSDSFTTSELSVGADNFYSIRARSGVSLGLVNGIDGRGTTNRPLQTEPDRWQTLGLNGRFIYGAREAKGRIEADLGYQAKTYQNNRAATEVADVTTTAVAGRFFYRLGTRSMALAEVRNSHADYPSALATNNNVEWRYYAGLTWDATASTTGVVKLGQLTKDFSAPGKSGFSGGSWEAEVRWAPLTYSVVNFKTSKATAEPSGLGDYRLNTTTEVAWRHQWNQSIGTKAAWSLLNSEYSGAAVSRTDNTNEVKLGVDYQFRRWLKLGVDFSTTDRTSNVAAAAYRRNVTLFSLEASL